MPGDSKVWGVLGGEIIGAGEHARVRVAAEGFLDAANHQLGEFVPANDYPPPSLGRVRFYVHTLDGLRTTDRDEQDLGYRRDSLWPVFHAGHAVISVIRELDEGGPGKP